MINNLPNDIFIGIDPGYTGAIAIFRRNQLTELWDMPTIQEKGKKRKLDLTQLSYMFNSLSKGHPRIAYIEQVSAMPGQGVTSMFNFGYQVGALDAFLKVHSWEVEKIRPQDWKKTIGLIGKPKDAARAEAQARFPERADSFNLVKHHGRADAALLAWAGYCQRSFRLYGYYPSQGPL